VQATWDNTTVRQLLKRETYAGVEYYGMSYRVADPATGDITIIRRPRGDWKRRETPDLRVIPDDLWARAQARLKVTAEAYRRRTAAASAGGPTRAGVYPSALVRPVCGYCGLELWLGRAGKYASFCCRNGAAGKKGCGLRTYKTVRIVEEAVLAHVQAAVFGHEFAADLVAAANAHLAAEAARPREDTWPIRAAVKATKAKRDRLLQLCETGGGELASVAARVKAHETELATLAARLREADGRLVPADPIGPAEVEAALAVLRDLLGDAVAVAAPILRELTGPVVVTQEATEGKRGASWTASFSIDAVPVLARLTQRRGCPTTGAWEYLSTAGWKSPLACRVATDFVPRYASLAADVKRLAKAVPASSASRRPWASTTTPPGRPSRSRRRASAPRWCPRCRGSGRGRGPAGRSTSPWRMTSPGCGTARACGWWRSPAASASTTPPGCHPTTPRRPPGGESPFLPIPTIGGTMTRPERATPVTPSPRLRRLQADVPSPARRQDSATSSHC
jgi:site-specific DNA recombinase